MSEDTEKLAALEHEQWMKWAKALMKDEDLSPERVARWKKLFVAYSKLKPEDKKDDRVWARKAEKLVKEFLRQDIEETYSAKLIEMNKRELLTEIMTKNS